MLLVVNTNEFFIFKNIRPSFRDETIHVCAHFRRL